MASLDAALLSRYRDGLTNASAFSTPTSFNTNESAPNFSSPYYDPQTDSLILPGMASLGGGIAVIPNAGQYLQGYSQRGNLNGMPQYNYDRDGNLISQTAATGFSSGDSALGEFGIGAAMMLPAFAAGIAGAGAGAAAGAGGAVDTAAMGAGSAGLGSSGTGLTLGGGATGLTAGTGTGLTLAGNAVAPGMMTAAAPGASLIGSGIGTGLAAGTGSLLGAAALYGTGGAAGTAGLAGTAGAGGAGATTAEMAGLSSSVIPEGAAFAPATAAEMSAMGLGGAGMAIPSWLGPAASVAGGLLGSQGQQTSATSTRELPDYLRAPVTDLVGRTQGLLGDQMAPAYAAGQQMMGAGTGLLNAPVAGNGVGQVTLNAPNTPTNPYLSSMASDIQRRTQDMLGANNLAIQGNAVAAGGLGGSRQGIAQGTAAAKAADYLSGNLAGLYGNAYSQDQNRALQQYQSDQGFFTQQRGQDLAQVGVGSGLLGDAFRTQFAPLQGAASVYSPFSGMGSTTTSQQQGGGAMGALGGALGMAQLGKVSGWWG